MPSESLQVPLTIEVEWDPGATGCDESSLGEQIVRAVRQAARYRGFERGSIGVLVTDDVTIHEINVRHLDHDYPTDVISFGYTQADNFVEGELVASWDTAQREAGEYGWTAIHELLLYVVHGTLHVCGMDDQTEEDAEMMRVAERDVLQSLGILLNHPQT